MGRGVQLSGPARKQGLWWLSQEPCGVRKRLASHIEQHAVASVMVPWLGLEALWFRRTCSHSGVVDRVQWEPSVTSTTSER